LPCPFEGKCKFSHDVAAYLEKAKEVSSSSTLHPSSTLNPEPYTLNTKHYLGLD
jgi:hypothetical protein